MDETGVQLNVPIRLRHVRLMLLNVLFCKDEYPFYGVLMMSVRSIVNCLSTYKALGGSQIICIYHYLRGQYTH